MERKNDTIIVTTRLPTSLKEKVDRKVKTSEYMSISDFVRQAIREKMGEEL